jgi:hypothetical protein
MKMRGDDGAGTRQRLWGARLLGRAASYAHLLAGPREVVIAGAVPGLLTPPERHKEIG